MKMLDLTHCITPEMPVYPGTEPPRLTAACTMEKDGFRETLLEMYSHTGTHMDAPAHMLPSGRTLDDFPAETFAGRGFVVDCRGAAEITLPMLRRQEEALGEAEFLLFCTGWDRYWGQPRYYEGFPCLTAEAAEYVASLGLKGVGEDSISGPLRYDGLSQSHDPAGCGTGQYGKSDRAGGAGGQDLHLPDPAAEMGARRRQQLPGYGHAPGGGNKIMGKLRFLLALWLAKLSVPALKITRHNGTDFPGSLALKLCPDFLRYVGKPGTIIAVTGTNGKTTVSNLLTDILEADGKKVLSNRSGSNITSGISTALLRGCDLLGRAKPYDMAVLEVDERASVRIFPYVKPDYVVVTNLTRDSIMRNAHPGYIADILTRSIPQTATMILNADDLITCGVAPENRRVYFGVDRLPGDTTRCENLIDDLRICPKCSGKLTYVYRRYHHIGKCVCPDCGFHSPESDYLATDVDMEKGTMALREGGEEHPYRLISDSVPNLYNMVTVIAVLRQLGYSHEAISGYMSRAAVVATRHMEEQVGDVKLVRQMSKEKNALAGSRTFQYIAQRPGTKELLLMMNCLGDAHHWSENTCWIFDADFEYLCNDSVVQLVCTGARCRDYKLRLLMAGVPQERIVCEPDEFRAAELLRYTPGDDVYILYGTDSLALSYKVYDHMKEEAARHAQDGAEKEAQA